jgi:hypothetical protein
MCLFLRVTDIGEATFIYLRHSPWYIAGLKHIHGAHAGALEVPDEDPTKVGPVVDLVPRQVL